MIFKLKYSIYVAKNIKISMKTVCSLLIYLLLLENKFSRDEATKAWDENISKMKLRM